MGVDQFLGEAGGHKKTRKQYIGENCLKRGAWAICKGLGKKEGGVCFWVGVDTPMHTMS